MRKGKWTDEEVNILTENLGKITYKEVAKILDRTEDSIQKKVKSLGLSKKIKKRLWSDDEIIYLTENYGRVHAKDIASQLNRTYDSVQLKAKSLSLRGMIQGEWSNDELEYLKENYGKLNTDEIAIKLGRTCESVKLKANRMGLKFEEKYHYDIDYFNQIDTEEKAYWLGFIYADGYVSKSERGYEFGIEIGKGDIQHLHKFNKSISGNLSIGIRKRTNKVREFVSNVCSIRIYSKQFVENLINKGVLYKKTNILEFPKYIDKSSMRHFIRGFIDGDGYLTFRKRNDYGYTTRLGFVCNSINFTKDILEFLSNELELGELGYYKDGNNYNFDTSNQKQLLKIADYLYKDSNIYLDRKYETYKKINHYLNNRLAYRKRNLSV